MTRRLILILSLALLCAMPIIGAFQSPDRATPLRLSQAQTDPVPHPGAPIQRRILLR
ncbi:hypothetical protein [Pseudooceanicola nanhaiensis]|uniref:hypothetical protein n=1 Tax=Pseudooceanicola nanhaiensis TaxID=375761 RepID=UPI001CD2A0E7|nr:hypothetical protein [Pseudooceanicola nanhaiensis]MCA0919052.1 hypothetical protein [Pseudooceanicola nanhaiensis]